MNRTEYGLNSPSDVSVNGPSTTIQPRTQNTRRGWLFKVALGTAIALLLSSGPAFADTAKAEKSTTEKADTKTPDAQKAHAQKAKRILEATKDADDEIDAPVEPVDYEEISEVRVLERDLIPLKKSSADAEKSGAGIAGEDRLRTRGDAAVMILMDRDSDASPDTSLSTTLSPRMEGALDQAKKDIESAKKNDELEMPFGLTCTEEPTVESYIALLSDPGSKTMKIWLQRSGKWRGLIEPILEEEGVPKDLLYLAMIESGYKTQVKSHANAGGMWQFIPSTGVSMGLRIDEWVDERFDPVKSTRAAARYLKKQHDRFKSWPLAMAAYNGGAGLVGKAIKTYNSNSYFKLVEYGAMYDETRRYVPKILAAALIGKNPEAFGFAGLEMHKAWSFDEVKVPGDMRLSLAAEAAKTDLETIEALNPELLKAQTPPGDDYVLRIPKGTHADFVAAFDGLEEKYGTKHERITLRFGESIEGLADRVGVPSRVLRAINGLSRRERMAYGTEVIVPTKGRTSGGSKNKKSTKKKGKKGKKDDERPVILVSATDFSFPERERVFYTVNSGDSVDEIAEHFGLRRAEVALWNDLDADAKLRKGMVVQLFLETLPDEETTVFSTDETVRAMVIGSPEHEKWAKGSGKSKKKNSHRSYKVKRGDTVSKIAKKFGVSSKDIIRWNNLKKNGAIRTGMRLVIR